MIKNKSLTQLSKEMKVAQTVVDGEYIAKFKFAKAATSLAPTEEEKPFLIRHVARVYGIFVSMLLYTGGLMAWFYFHPQHYIPFLD